MVRTPLGSPLLEKHLAECAERNAQQKARKVALKHKRRNAYFRKWRRAQRVKQRKEVAELLRVIKRSMKEW